MAIATASRGMGADGEPEREAVFGSSILQKGMVSEVMQEGSARKDAVLSVLQMMGSSTLCLVSGTG